MCMCREGGRGKGSRGRVKGGERAGERVGEELRKMEGELNWQKE